ncbi:hypothetical protein ACMC56_02850 [Campylobacterota bacterium DY0563]
MKNIILLILLSSIQLFAFKSDVKQIFAFTIYDEKGHGENIQNIRKTVNDYNGICFTKIFLRGSNLNIKPKVMIGNSKGKYVDSKPVYKNKIMIGKIMTYKHLGVDEGLLKIIFRKKLYDARVYVK